MSVEDTAAPAETARLDQCFPSCCFGAANAATSPPAGPPRPDAFNSRLQPMSPILGLTLLGLACLAGLVLIALGLPGLWVEVIAVIGYGWIGDFRTIGLATMGVVFGLAVV